MAFNDFSGRRADGVPVKGIVPQLDGNGRGGDNCAAAAEAARVIRETLNRDPHHTGAAWPPTAGRIRIWSGDTSGGMTPHQTTKVTHERYGTRADIRIASWDEVYQHLRKGGHCTILIGYLPIAEVGLSGSPGFYGNHSDSLAGITGTGTTIELTVGDSLWDGRRTGIPKGLQQVRISTMKRAAGALVLPGGRMRDVYPGKVYCVFGTRFYTPPATTLPFRLYPGATRLKKPRIYSPTRRLWMRKTPKSLSTNHIGTVAPGFRFEAYQYIINEWGKWVGNKRATAWLRFDSIEFVRYI